MRTDGREGTLLLELSIPELGAPVSGLESDVRLTIVATSFDAKMVEIAWLPYDRLELLVTDRLSGLEWRCLSPLIRRVGAGVVKVGISWCTKGYMWYVDGCTAGNSAASDIPLAIPVGQRAEFGDEDWRLKRSERARKRRRERSVRLLRGNPQTELRLKKALIERAKNLRDALAAVKQGRTSRLLDIATHLRALLADGGGNEILLRVAGLIDARLDVFWAAAPTYNSSAVELPEADAAPAIFAGPIPGYALFTDLDVWLRTAGWRAEGQTYTNEAAVREFGNTEGAHTDDFQHPLMDWMRRLAAADNAGRHRDLLLQWIISVSEAVLILIDREILPHIASKIGPDRQLDR